MIRLLAAAALAALAGPALAQQSPAPEQPSAVSDPSATAGTVAPPVPAAPGASGDRDATGSVAPGGATGHSQSGYGTFDPNRPDARSATGAGQPPAR